MTKPDLRVVENRRLTRAIEAKRREREKAQKILIRQFGQLMQKGQTLEQEFIATINEMRWWARLGLAVRVALGRVKPPAPKGVDDSQGETKCEGESDADRA